MKTYEELSGAQGRRVFYRAERFEARDLFSRRPPAVVVGGARFSLDNISMTGLAASLGLDAELDQDSVDDIAIEFEGDNEPLFRGQGRVQRIERNGRDTRVALAFTGAPLDIPNLVSRYNESLLKRELNGGLHHALDAVAPEYRQHCVDVLHLLRRYKGTLDKFEAASLSDAQQQQALYDMCEQRILPEWRSLWRRGNDLIRPLMGDPEAMQPVKEFTEYVLTPELMAGPIWHRSYTKPLGYPGDFEVMNKVYRWAPGGETVYQKLVDRVGLEVAECIATRMVMVQQSIASTVARGAGAEGPVRVLSLGCGPAQEVQNFLEVKSLPHPVEFTLVDQDQDALSLAYEKCYARVIGKNDGSAVNCLQMSFVELMKVGKIFRDLPQQDLIYTVGLVDYLSLRRIQDLAASLYGKLAQGGKLIIGNMADVDLGNQWPMEFICDWGLHYRNRDEMFDFAAQLPPEAERALVPDPTGRVYMLELRKPLSAG